MLKVASYCRVSTDKTDQANSFESQQRYFRAYIHQQPDWELYQIYADEGITGTSTKKRTAFNRMIQDAYQGKFQLILTKEVSRFSRNILDTIAYTRELKQLGVGVLFMNDAIHTMEPDAELRLSIMGSIAQEESRKTSSRVKWGQTRQMERGVVFGPSLLGYHVEHGVMTIDPEGAEVVRLIFQKYGIEKKGTTTIARELEEAGYLTHTGNPKWSNSHILKILKNEKYVGDLVQKKSITQDYLTHSKKYNHGEEELVVLRNHHAPIIDRALWELVQTEIKTRNRHGTPGGGHSNRYALSGKLKCGSCGASFVSRKRARKDGGSDQYWSCYTAVREGRRHLDSDGTPLGCDLGRTIRNELAVDILKQVLNTLQIDRAWIVRHVTTLAIDAIEEAQSGDAACIAKLNAEIDWNRRKKENVLDAFFSGSITQEEMQMMRKRYDQALTGLKNRLDGIRARQDSREDAAALRESLSQQIASMINGSQSTDLLFRSFLKQMTVFQTGEVEVCLQDLPQTWRFLLTRNTLPDPPGTVLVEKKSLQW